MSLWIDFYRAIEVCFVQTRQIFQITFDNDWFSFTKDLGVFLGLVYLVFLFFWLLLSVFFFQVRCLEKKCNYYSSWSKWSATCGNGVKRSKRLRSTSNSYHTVNNLSQCAQYKTSCDGYLYQTKDLNKCPG